MARAVGLRIEEEPAQPVVRLGVVRVELDGLLEQIARRAGVVGGLPFGRAQDQLARFGRIVRDRGRSGSCRRRSCRCRRRRK